MFLFNSRKKFRTLENRIINRTRVLHLTQHYQELARTSTETGTFPTRTPPLIVSLTTFDKRIWDVHLTIESIFNQAVKADKILLWISRDHFTEDSLPTLLKNQITRGLEVKFCDRDLGPYTKYHYTLLENPESLIVTVDDDILYPVDMLDQLYRAHLEHPKMIHCHRAHKITQTNGTLDPYKQWPKEIQDTEPSPNIFPTGVGGVLYPPNCFDSEISNVEAFMKLCPKADDVWLKAMSLKKGTLCKKINDTRSWPERFPIIEGSQRYSLKRANKSTTSGNDSKLKTVFEKYQLTI